MLQSQPVKRRQIAHGRGLETKGFQVGDLGDRLQVADTSAVEVQRVQILEFSQRSEVTDGRGR